MITIGIDCARNPACFRAAHVPLGSTSHQEVWRLGYNTALSLALLECEKRNTTPPVILTCVGRWKVL